LAQPRANKFVPVLAAKTPYAPRAIKRPSVAPETAKKQRVVVVSSEGSNEWDVSFDISSDQSEYVPAVKKTEDKEPAVGPTDQIVDIKQELVEDWRPWISRYDYEGSSESSSASEYVPQSSDDFD